MRPSEYAGTDLVDPGSGSVGVLRPEFSRVVYGGFPFSEQLDGSVKSRIKDDIGRENTQCLDLTDPQALFDTGKSDVASLTAADFAMNASAFHDAGFSKGLGYNVFCSANVALADGRIATLGGHDKIGNDGIAKVNVLDPVDESWASRVLPQARLDWDADPSGVAFPHADALRPDNVDPPDPADLKYGRWYPSALTLPDGRVLVLSGTDIDSTQGPSAAPFAKVRRETPEVWDPVTETTVALESARKLLMMYPRSYVVQTGPGWDDWKVMLIGEAQPPYPTEAQLKSSFDPWHYDGKTYLLDVLGALSDPARDTAGNDHYQLVATAAIAHDEGAGAQLWTLGPDGQPTDQCVALFGGSNGRGSSASAVVEMIDFADAAPAFKQQQPLDLPVTQNNAVVLPDGKVLVVGGSNRAAGAAGIEYNYQLFDPALGTTTVVGRTTVPRHDHSTALLLPDASVLVMGGNREDLVPADKNAGVPAAQLYQPAYLFRGPRPDLDAAPDEIGYGDTFQLEVSATTKVSRVVLIRTGPVTHNWDWGNRSVRLSFEEDDGTLTVAAPAVPGAAIPGAYLLFVVDADGVPSKGRLLWLRL